MRLNVFFILVVLILTSASVHAQTEASIAMENEDFSKAAELYEGMTQEGQASYPLFVNLGTAYTRLGDYGKARLAFERALKIEPNGKEAKNNINYVKQQLSDEIIEVEPFFLYRWWQSLALALSTTTWFILNFLFLLSSLYLVYQYLLGNSKFDNRKVLYGIGFAVFCLFMTFFLGSSRKHQLQRTDTAVIMTATELRLGADEKSESVSPLEAGHKIIILDQIGDWYKVSKLDKEQGWVKTENFERI